VAAKSNREGCTDHFLPFAERDGPLELGARARISTKEPSAEGDGCDREQDHG